MSTMGRDLRGWLKVRAITKGKASKLPNPRMVRSQRWLLIMIVFTAKPKDTGKETVPSTWKTRGTGL